MLLKKEGYPQEDELVLCTISNIQYHSVFATLDEYGRSGMIHISEVSPGRIRNIREFVTEGKKVVCKVLRIDKLKGHIDLSLRRVNDAQRRAKLDEIKKEQLAENIIEYVAKKLAMPVQNLYSTLRASIMPKYGTIYPAFEEVARDETTLEKIGIEKKLGAELTPIIKARIKPPEVEIKGQLKLTTYAPDGIEIIHKAFKTGLEGLDAIKVQYLGAGTYGLSVKAPDYKEAEQTINKCAERITEFAKKHQATAEYHRVE